jgi:hypothetical protein
MEYSKPTQFMLGHSRDSQQVKSNLGTPGSKKPLNMVRAEGFLWKTKNR